MFLTNLLVTIMSITMPTLPYANNALEPVISEQTIDFHYGKHLQNYVNTLNTLIQGTEFEGKSVEDIVKAAPDGPIFNNAGQTLTTFSTSYSLSRPLRVTSLRARLQKLWYAISVALRTSRKSSHKLVQRFSARVGHGSRKTRTANWLSPRNLTQAIHYVMATTPFWE